MESLAQHEPFYFKSFDRVIGVAHNEAELYSEAERLAVQDPKALEYHVAQGHIVTWLKYIGRDDIAESLESEKPIELDRFMNLLRMALAGANETVKCPYCGHEAPYIRYRLARPPWLFGAYAVRVLICPSCGRRFRLYYPVKRGLTPFTVPRPGTAVNA